MTEVVRGNFRVLVLLCVLIRLLVHKCFKKSSSCMVTICALLCIYVTIQSSITKMSEKKRKKEMLELTGLFSYPVFYL